MHKKVANTCLCNGLKWLEPGEAVTREELEAAEKAQGETPTLTELLFFDKKDLLGSAGHDRFVPVRANYWIGLMVIALVMSVRFSLLLRVL